MCRKNISKLFASALEEALKFWLHASLKSKGLELLSIWACSGQFTVGVGKAKLLPYIKSSILPEKFPKKSSNYTH